MLSKPVIKLHWNDWILINGTNDSDEFDVVFHRSSVSLCTTMILINSNLTILFRNGSIFPQRFYFASHLAIGYFHCVIRIIISLWDSWKCQVTTEHFSFQLNQMFSSFRFIKTLMAFIEIETALQVLQIKSQNTYIGWMYYCYCFLGLTHLYWKLN